jgi:hypothetical protein
MSTNASCGRGPRTPGLQIEPRTAERSRYAGQRRRRSRGFAALVLATVGLSAFAASASADGTVTLPGGPLIVSVGSLGECQSSYANVGVNFFPPSGTLGDCGFFLAFPAKSSNPKALLGESEEGTVYGFSGAAGPHITSASSGGREYTAIEQGAVTGSGTEADPYTEVTKFKVSEEASGDFAVVTVTTRYVNGQPQFTATYDVQNITGMAASGELKPAKPAETIRFHAIVAGDLFVANDDHGTGVFLGGPPRFIGGQNPSTGTLGGFLEVPSSPWSNWQEGYWDGPVSGEGFIPQDQGIWNAVRISPQAGEGVFNDTIDPNLMDNGAGVSWDQFLTNGLEPKQHATFTIVSRAQVPSTLGIQPVNQTLTVGQTGTVTVTATDNVGTPYAGRPLVYSIGGANPKSGSVTTNASGVATISYVGAAAGLDTIQMFLDLAGTGVQAPQDPSSAAQLTWLPPAPNSSYTVQSIHANADGTVTIVFVPTQPGTANIVVTVPTASIASNATVARSKRCKKGQVRIKGKCRPANTVSGKVTAKGVAGVPLKITVKPSSKVKRLLKKGKTVTLTATLTYTSALGGKPTVRTFHVKVKGKRHH